jgi:hypothetical protein
LENLLAQLPNLVTVDVAVTACPGHWPRDIPGVSKCFNTLASMPRLKALTISKCKNDDFKSWAVPFASGGLSYLSLHSDLRDDDDLADVEAILAFHADTLREINLIT